MIGNRMHPPIRSRRGILVPLSMCWVLLPLVAEPSDARDVTDLLQRLPQAANVVALIRVNEILESPRAAREAWAEQQESEFLAGAAVIPPWVTTFVRASHVHPGADSHGWSVAVLTTSRDINMEDTSQRENAVAQTISGKPSVRTHRNAYFIQLEPRVLGIVSPAFRQDAVRWIHAMENRPPQTDNWLDQTVTQEAAYIAIAVDLRDVFDPDLLRIKLETSRTRNGQLDRLVEIQRLLESIEGVCFTANVGDSTSTQIRIDFRSDVPPRGAIMKSLILEFLDDSDAALEDFEDCHVRIDGRSIRRVMTAKHDMQF